MQNKYETKDSSLAFILAIVLPNVLAFFILIVAGIISGDITKIESTIFYKIMATTLSQVAFLGVYFFIIKRKKMQVFKSLDKRKLNFKQIVILILISLVCLFLISPIINVFDAWLVSIGVSSSALPISLDKPLNLIYMILTLGLLAPIAEELLFRGVIFSGLKEKGNKTAVLISSLMFMLVHLNLHQTIYQFILGIILAVVVLYTGNIFASILIHFINNTTVLLINYINPYFFDYNFLSSNYIILAVVLLFLAGLTIVNLLKMLKNRTFFDNFDKKLIKNTNKSEKVTNNYFLLSIAFGIIMWIITVVISL